MPGAIPHLITGLTIFFVTLIFYKNYLKKQLTERGFFSLFIICLFFSIFPDIFLIIFYSTNMYNKCIFEPYHIIFHLLLIPFSLIAYLLIKFKLKIKNEEIYIIAIICILVHLILDIFAPEEINMWI
jgi:hypothetical protein